MRDTASMVLGAVGNVHVVSLSRDDKEPVSDEVERLLASFSPREAVYILTDMLGSSVNNEMVALAQRHPGVTVIAGANMPLALTIAMSTERIEPMQLASIVDEARAGLTVCAGDMPDVVTDTPRRAKARPAVPSGSTTISLVRLDYRLLHGQVVFSWVGSVGAQRIIVIDDAVAADKVRVGALKLAKPVGVRLNVMTVEQALGKMPRVMTLGENVMFIFGNTHDLRAFCTAHRGFREINYGATANHDGAEQIGGSGSSVFLDEAEKEDTRALLEMGATIFIQQTPSTARIELTSV